MPRGPRLDAPGILRHVMARGIERRPIFRDDRDGTDFVVCLAALIDAEGERRKFVNLSNSTRTLGMSRFSGSGPIGGYRGADSIRQRRGPRPSGRKRR